MALPTAKPIWLVLERDDVLADGRAPSLLDQLTVHPGLVEASLRQVVDLLTRPRLFVPLGLMPSLAGETMLALSLFGPGNGE